MIRLMTMMMLAMTLLMKSDVVCAEEYYATKNGKKYHQAGCVLVKDKGLRALAVSEIEARKLLACGHCLRGRQKK